MNFLTMRSSTACLFLLHLSSCYAGPVRSPRTTSAVKLHDFLMANIQGVSRNDQPSQIQDYLIPIEENNGDLSDTTNEPFVDQSAFQDFDVQEPERVTHTLTYFSLPAVSNGETEQPALPLDANVIHSDLPNSGSIETEILSDVQEPTQNLEEPHSETVGEQEPVMDHMVVLPIETTELYHLPTVAVPSDPAELLLMYSLVRVPTAPSATSATVTDSLLEIILPSTTEKWKSVPHLKLCVIHQPLLDRSNGSVSTLFRWSWIQQSRRQRRLPPSSSTSSKLIKPNATQTFLTSPSLQTIQMQKKATLPVFRSDLIVLN